MGRTGQTVTLRVNSDADAELLAKALRDSCWPGLTVKQFHYTEARDVLRLLWALQYEAQADKEEDHNG